MESEVTLKPCPFCGGRADFHNNTYSKRVTIWCTNPDCGVKPFTMYTESFKEAVKNWNSRATDEGNTAKLREALTKVSEWMAHRIATGGFEASPTIPTVLEDVVLPALAAPSRECDAFADDKQADALHAAFVEHCNKCDCPMGCDHRKNPRFLLDTNCASILKCFAQFALSRKAGAK